MLINPVISANISFGTNNAPEKKRPMLATAAAGAVLGAGAAKLSSIKANPDDVDSFIKTIEEKLPMSSDTKTDVQRIKATISSLKEESAKKLQDLGITPETKEVTSEALLNKVIHPNQPDKTLKGLSNDIEYIEGEARGLKGKPGKSLEYAEKLKIIDERKNIKKLIEEAVDGKIDANKIRNIYETPLNKNPKISGNLNNLNNITKKFNKQRYILFPIIGLALGAAIGSFIKLNNNKDK